MRRFTVAIVVIMSMLLLSSCIGGSRVAMLNRYDDSGIADARLEQIIEAINSKDRDAIVAMFSETALSEAEDIDGGIDYLFSLFEDDIDMESWKQLGGHVSESNDYGHRTKSINYIFSVCSGEKEYWLSIVEDTVDTDHPENVGLYTICALPSADADADENSRSYGIGGIYVPVDEDRAAYARLEQVFTLIKDKDKDAIKALFSEKALSANPEIDGEIDELLDFFPNGIDSWKKERNLARRYITYSHKEIDCFYAYMVYADGEAYRFQMHEYFDWTGRPEIVGVSYITISLPEVVDSYDNSYGINFLEE